MDGRRGAGSEAGLGRLSRRIEQWRAAGRPGKRMPAALWDDAVGVARAQGCYRVARVLGLNYASLRARVEGAGARTRDAMAAAGQRQETRSAATPTFAEVDLGAVLGGALAGATVEVARRDGARMQIRLAGAGAAQAAVLLAAFLGEAGA